MSSLIKACIAVMLFCGWFAPITIAQPGLPPADLRAYPGGTVGTRYLLKEAGQFVRVDLSIDTVNKQVILHYAARGEETASERRLGTRQTVSFYPVAYDYSRNDQKSFYVVGKSALVTVLERWTFSPFVLSASNGKTNFTPPTISKESLPIDNTIGNICAMAINKWPAGGGAEEVWLMNWDNHNVYAIDRVTGAKSVRISGAQTQGGYRTMDIKEHPVYGMVCMFWKPAFFQSMSGSLDFEMSPNNTSIAFYDQNKDGTFDGTFIGQNAVQWNGNWQSHPLYSSGQFLPRD